MDLKKLYSLRRDFTVIGLTGRTGSGCSSIADLLAGTFDNLDKKGLRPETDFSDEIFKKKYSICRTFLSHGTNWIPFEIIRYVDVLLFYILHKHGGNVTDLNNLLKTFYKESSQEVNKELVTTVRGKVIQIDEKYRVTIEKIKKLKPFNDLKSDEELSKIGELFFNSDFKDFKNELFKVLEEDNGYFRTRCMLHWVSCNLRSCGDAIGEGKKDIENIFSIANLINRLIKAKKVMNGDKPTKIVIDSLRNSLEIMFFKERYSAFYMLASKDVIDNTKKRINKRLESKIEDLEARKVMIEKILKLDETEYRTKDFAKGTFSSPDVENCIQKSDFHVFNLKKDLLEQFVIEKFEGKKDGFFTREEQIMKLVTLILQPGLITPSSAERAMQIANTAKLNSGCISRKVGAVVSDTSYYIRSVGWNDIAKGHTPCNLRSITDFFNEVTLSNNPHYSPFEKGVAGDNSTYKYKDKSPGNFKDALLEYFGDSYKLNSKDLNGKNCSFCFKTVHNHFEGEANQVHTRSLHAEENAMLQITKLGGIGAEGGFLFTTASPCELCAKKAYQLGITKIFYIDPYPGISVDQILKGGHYDSQPKLVPFYGAIGNAYHELYDSFMSYKDEISMTLEIKPKQKTVKELNNALSKIDDAEINTFLRETNLNDKEVIDLVKNVIKLYKSKEKSE